MKYFKYMLVAAITLFVAASCQEDAEDAFLTDPTAPVLTDNGSILLTENTMSESITWSWTKARFFEGNVTYTLYGMYDDSVEKEIGSTSDLTLSMPKSSFKSIADSFGAPANSSFVLKFYVVASANGASAKSDATTVNIYSYGSAVAPVVSAVESSIALDMNNPTGEVALLTWDEARLGFNEDITYRVVCSVNGGDEFELANGLTTTSFSTTVDGLNEAAVACGAEEGAAGDVDFVVYAVSSTYADGVPSEKVTINITTYVATFPDVVYLPGNYCGWGFKETCATIPQSTSTKGLFEAFVDLTTSDGGDVEFKFSPVAAWDGDFGSDDLEVTVGGQNNTTIAKGTTTGGSNLKVPSGMYRVSMNMKFKTVELENVVSVGLIGSAVSTGWGSEIKMEYDATARTYSVSTELTKDGEYKFRINDDWDFSIGDNGAFSGGANYKFDKESGEYKVILNVASHPYAVKVLSTSYPEKLYMPGSYCGWGFGADCATLEGNGEGMFEGGVQLGTSGDTQFKFSPVAAWNGDFGCNNLAKNDKGVYEGTYGASDNIVVPAGYYYLTVDMTTTNITLTPITSLGFIGGFADNTWSSDVAKLTFDAEKNVWTGTLDAKEGNEWKIRANDSWDWNRGGTFSALGSPFEVVGNGANVVTPADGTYTVTLDLAHNPNTITVKK